MNNFIPEDEYQKIIKTVPIFCVDFLIKCDTKHLLIKRAEEPHKGVYSFVGGRLLFNETIDELAFRIQNREIGRYFENRKLIAFSNYFFPDVPKSRAIHTPSLLYLVEVDEMFIPKLDETSVDYIWTEELPKELLRQTQFI